MEDPQQSGRIADLNFNPAEEYIDGVPTVLSVGLSGMSSLWTDDLQMDLHLHAFHSSRWGQISPDGSKMHCTAYLSACVDMQKQGDL